MNYFRSAIFHLEFSFELSALGVTSLMHIPAFLRDNVARICCMLLENPMTVFISKKILYCKSGMVVLKSYYTGPSCSKAD